MLFYNPVHDIEPTLTDQSVTFQSSGLSAEQQVSLQFFPNRLKPETITQFLETLIIKLKTILSKLNV